MKPIIQLMGDFSTRIENGQIITTRTSYDENNKVVSEEIESEPVFEPFEIDEGRFSEWVATRPPKVQEACKLVRPGRLYNLKQTGQFVTVEAYGEDGTVRVTVQPGYRPMDTFPFEVFGVDPADLEQCGSIADPS